MAKFSGMIGFAESVEIEPGIYEEQITERFYTGDELKIARRLQNSSSVNDNIVISNQISIVADPYATQNFHTIRYAVRMGVKWKVESIDVQRPRLIMSLGGVYNGQ